MTERPSKSDRIRYIRDFQDEIEFPSSSQVPSHSESQTPTPSDIEVATNYSPKQLFTDDEMSNSTNTSFNDLPSQNHDFLLPAPSISKARTRERRSSSLISLQTINNTISKIKTEITDRYKRYNELLRKKPSFSARSSEIYYSVFKSIPGVVSQVAITPPSLLQEQNREKDFDAAVEEAHIAINTHPPRRIAAGSSGSYFIDDSGGFTIAVFKPKDEEPYGPLSPKWTKWIHRNLFPCFFGRSCLIPNNGYICESAASLLDRQLQTYIVPHTDTVELQSRSFYYGWWRSQRGSSSSIYPKIGSFQLFLHGYMGANEFFYKHPLPEGASREDSSSRRYRDEVSQQFEWTEEVLQQFREELEKLVILDYIMRNTDRGLDNWMIKLEWETREVEGSQEPTKFPRLKIGAIDNGLAFPWKHPDEWRSYPFGWLFLPLSIIDRPFSQKTRDHFLPILLSTDWWQETTAKMKDLFQRDSEFKERMWKKQWAVAKGQAFNVVETLKATDQGPLELARRQRVMVWDDEMEVPIRVPSLTAAINTPLISLDNGSQNRRGGFDDDDDDDGGPLSPGGNQQPKRNQTSLDHDQLSSFPTPENQNQHTPNSRHKRHGSKSLEQRYRQLEQERVQQSPYRQPDSGSVWRELINEEEGRRPAVSPPVLNNVGLSHAEDDATSANRQVIVERLQTVTSKPPVFTWC